MFAIPFDRLSYSSVVSVIDGLASSSSDVRLESKIVEENVESLLLALGQSNEAIVEWQRPILELLKNGLKDDDIIKCRSLLEEIRGIEEGVCIWD